MGKLRKVVFYLMIPIVIICMIEGGIYYRTMGLKADESFLCSLDNLIKMFIARPTIQPYLAFRSINESYTRIEVVITYIYSVFVIVAPILMTTAVIAGFSAYIYDFFNSIKISFRPKMFIIGDGAMAKVIASKYSKKFFVHYLMPSDTTSEKRVPLLREKIKAYPVDYRHADKACKMSKMEKASYVVLNFKDWFKSYATVTEIIEYLIRENDDCGLPVYIVDVPGVFRNVFENMYRGFCNKYGKSWTLLSFSYINVNNMNAKHFFENPHLKETSDKKHHIVLTGAGGYGRALLKELASYMIKNGLTGTIEIFDRHIDSSINNLMYARRSLKHVEQFSEAPTAKNAKLSIDQHTEVGTIRLNFYQASIGEFKATDYLNDILEQGEVTEYFCCIENVETSFECFRMIEGFGDMMSETKLYFRVGPNFENAFDAMKMDSPRLEFLPDNFPDIELIKGDSEKE